ncbi:MAG: RDD family protein [Bacteroidota bacterium]
MQTIEINTTQNVVIKYEVAVLRDRILAFLLDFIILSATLIFLLLAFTAFGEAGMYVYITLSSIVFFFYTLVAEAAFNGQTIGKRALDIKVVRLDGKHPKISDYAMRWVFRMIDIYLSFGTLASIFVSSSSKGQRLGDLLADTTIIKVKPKTKLNFNDISKIKTLDNHAPDYPQVKKLSEADMLLIKTTIQRYQKYKNDAHRKALVTLAEKIKTQLNITNANPRHIEFLKALITDYVALTR